MTLNIDNFKWTRQPESNIKPIQGTRFRQWATQRLHEYIVKGYAMDDERLKNLGGGSYWKELLDRIRDIRSS